MSSSVSLPYLDRTLFGIIAAFTSREKRYCQRNGRNYFQRRQRLWSQLAGDFGFASVVVAGVTSKETLRNGLLHSWNDEPALITAAGDRYWFYKGKCHRNGDLPAIIYANGQQDWFKYGKLHRNGDLPARIFSEGDQFWFQRDKCHRDGDLPAIITSDGTQAWLQRDEYHRDGDLPAIIYANGFQRWYHKGVLLKSNWNADLFP